MVDLAQHSLTGGQGLASLVFAFASPLAPVSIFLRSASMQMGLNKTCHSQYVVCCHRGYQPLSQARHQVYWMFYSAGGELTAEPSHASRKAYPEPL